MIVYTTNTTLGIKARTPYVIYTEHYHKVQKFYEFEGYPDRCFSALYFKECQPLVRYGRKFVILTGLRGQPSEFEWVLNGIEIRTTGEGVIVKLAPVESGFVLVGNKTLAHIHEKSNDGHYWLNLGKTTIGKWKGDSLTPTQWFNEDYVYSGRLVQPRKGDAFLYDGQHKFKVAERDWTCGELRELLIPANRHRVWSEMPPVDYTAQINLKDHAFEKKTVKLMDKRLEDTLEAVMSLGDFRKLDPAKDLYSPLSNNFVDLYLKQAQMGITEQLLKLGVKPAKKADSKYDDRKIDLGFAACINFVPYQNLIFKNLDVPEKIHELLRQYPGINMADVQEINLVQAKDARASQRKMDQRKAECTIRADLYDQKHPGNEHENRLWAVANIVRRDGKLDPNTCRAEFDAFKTALDCRPIETMELVHEFLVEGLGVTNISNRTGDWSKIDQWQWSMFSGTPWDVEGGIAYYHSIRLAALREALRQLGPFTFDVSFKTELGGKLKMKLSQLEGLNEVEKQALRFAIHKELDSLHPGDLIQEFFQLENTDDLELADFETTWPFDADQTRMRRIWNAWRFAGRTGYRETDGWSLTQIRKVFRWLDIQQLIWHDVVRNRTFRYGTPWKAKPRNPRNNSK